MLIWFLGIIETIKKNHGSLYQIFIRVVFLNFIIFNTFKIIYIINSIIF